MSQPTDDRSQRAGAQHQNRVVDPLLGPSLSWDGYPQLMRGLRTGVIVLSVIAVLLGVAAIVWPGATLFTIAMLFGIYLVVTGIARVSFAVGAKPLRPALRWFVGVLGAAIVVVGVVLLSNPAASLLVFAILLGAGWILEGVISIVTGVIEVGFMPRWWAVVSGIIGVIAGITVLMLPTVALQAFVIVGGSLLIVIGLSTFIIAVQRPARAGA